MEDILNEVGKVAEILINEGQTFDTLNETYDMVESNVDKAAYLVAMEYRRTQEEASSL